MNWLDNTGKVTLPSGKVIVTVQWPYFKGAVPADIKLGALVQLILLK